MRRTACAESLEDIRALVDQGGGGRIALRTHSPDLLDPMVEVRHLGTMLTEVEVIAFLDARRHGLPGLEADVGTFEPGKIADLVTVDGDPSADLGALDRMTGVSRADWWWSTAGRRVPEERADDAAM
jgi:imidazolonepropionase-like amidohydrolase